MKNSSSLIGIFFIIFVSTFMLFTILIPDQNFSEQENRYLKQRPSFRLQSFFSGEFMEEFEEYIQDQFALKTKWLSLKTISEIFLFKQENNGVYFGKDGYLLEHFPSPSEQLQRNITSLNHFSLEDQKRKLYFLLAPTATEIYKEKLPPFAPTFSQKEVFSIVKEHLTSNYHWIDVFETLEKHKEDKIYFKTDHHWTMRGAFYAYEEAAEKMDFRPFAFKDFTIQTVSDEFFGTLFSKANAFHASADHLEVFMPTFPIEYELMLEGQEEIHSSLYDDFFLTQKDKYSYFLHGNHRLLTIHTSVDQERKLAVLKDSYAHVFIPFLANHYSEIHVIDLRYFSKNLYDYLDHHEIEEVLFLYNVKNFMKDTNLMKIQFMSQKDKEW